MPLHALPFDSAEIEIRVPWASRHHWQAGTDYDLPPGNYALWLVQEGAIEVRDEHKLWRLSAGEMLLWPGSLARHFALPVDAKWLSLGISVIALGHLDVLHWLRPPFVWRPSADTFAVLENWMQQIIDEFPIPRANKPDEFYTYVNREIISEYSYQSSQIKPNAIQQMLREGLARAIVARCWHDVSSADLSTVVATHAPAWIQSSLKQMRETPQTSVEELAHHAGFSSAQFRRRFHAATGTTPKEYLSRIRVEKARFLLETTDLPVRVVAAQCGFSSVPHFIQMFEQKTGWSPARYRSSSLRGVV